MKCKLILFYIFGLFFLSNSLCLAVDSEAIKPISAKPESIAVHVAAPNIASENYSSLPACPMSIQCPDVNNSQGYSQSQIQANCPSSCTVTRQVFAPQLGASPIQALQAFNPTAICPAGYAAVDTYNMQDEYIDNTDTTPITNLPDLNTLTKYMNSFYNCAGDGGNISWKYCVGISSPPSGTFMTVSTVNGTNTYTTTSQLKVGSYSTALNGQVAWIQSITPNNGRCTGRNPLGFPIASTFTTITYQNVQCVRPAGLVKTGNKSPASVVCARVSDQWQ